MGWNDLDDSTRAAIVQVDVDIGAITERGSISFSDRVIDTLTDDDYEAIREFTLNLLYSARRTILENSNG